MDSEGGTGIKMPNPWRKDENEEKKEQENVEPHEFIIKYALHLILCFT